MFMRVVFLLLITLAFTANNTYAQVNFHVGATTAYNATFVLDKGLAEDPRYNAAITYNWTPIGLNVGLDLTNKFGMSLESILSNQGQLYEMINTADEIRGSRKIDLTYLHLPLLLRFMGGGTGTARANFNIGPQLSILTQGVETIQADAGVYSIPEGVSFESIQQELAAPADFDKVIQLDANTYEVTQNLSPRDVLTKKGNDFRSAEFQLAAALGLDIDLSKHLYLTTQIRANYSLTDMRNGDVIDAIKSGNGGDIFGQRANLIVGVQLGLHYMFGKTRSYRYAK